jgi:hypothetical protein
MGRQLALRSRGKGPLFGYLIEYRPPKEVSKWPTDVEPTNELYARLALFRLFAPLEWAFQSSIACDSDGQYLWDIPSVFPPVELDRVSKRQLPRIANRYFSGHWGDAKQVLVDWQRPKGFEPLQKRFIALCELRERELLEWMRLEAIPNDRLLSYFFVYLIRRRLDLIATGRGEKKLEVTDWRQVLQQPNWNGGEVEEPVPALA